MSMFEITDSEPDASDVPIQSPEVQEQEEGCDEIADAAAAKSAENELMPLIAQPGKEPAMDRNEWTGEILILEYCCGSNSKIGNPINLFDNSSR
eukprot:7887297-Pyramimonas_sp.AAC.1